MTGETRRDQESPEPRMSRPIRYPRIQDVRSIECADPLHSEIDVTWREEDPPQRFCGDNWCTGACNLPALVIPWPPSPYDSDRFSKASGSQVACGSVMQGKRVNWTGARVEVPPEFRKFMEGRIWL